jgi:hypothetical protein
MPGVIHRIDQLAFHQVERRLPIEHDVMEGIGDNLRHPNQAGLHIFQEEQVHGSEDQASDSNVQPSHPELA